MSEQPTPPRRPYNRASAHQVENRRMRILSWVQGGLSFGEIADLERMSRERIRQIVGEALKQRDADRELDPRKLNEVRLEPALRLAARRIIENKDEGVILLLRVIAALEKHGPPKSPRRYDETARARLLAKLNLNVRKLPARPESLENTPEAPATP